MQPISYTYEQLVLHRDGGVSKAALDALRKRADKILTEPIYRVTEIPLPRPSKNNHEYMSVSPYRWPNPDTPDGLPWVRRDGVVNPETDKLPRAVTMYVRVHDLALAAFYFEKRREEYADFAVRQLYDWFINPETYMEPSARYTQSIPGVCDGCSPGIVDFASNYPLFDGIGILSSMGLIDDELIEGIKKWFTEFTNWLMTDDERGIAEGGARDNHGAWYDSQILCAAVFSGREHLVRRVLRSSYAVRIRGKIRPDGSQPEELLRTKPIGYSFYALRALFKVAAIGERLGYGEYWGIDEERGHCILKQAVDFLYPCVKDPKGCPYRDLREGMHGPDMAHALQIVAKRFPNEGYLERSSEFDSDSALWRLEPIF